MSGNRQICPVSAFRPLGRVKGAVRVLQMVQVPLCAFAWQVCPSSAVKLAVYSIRLRFKRCSLSSVVGLPPSEQTPNKPNRSGRLI
jgi:hypothetical protein